ncbi:hypothetical protein PtA15_10A730 [Puccinia triticina]|uniref:Integrase catalytic domain-containing protein n=1 Tax=Puccinia triticina TaxID=208348 RepID=A0ABY7CYW1_9BASI|nr:uncharacterized protein PtA15_10A730 [Puccinia triticina]WAQ89306.1 hypothetical protein PtA15_10A730 [Puccinia triticina]
MSQGNTVEISPRTKLLQQPSIYKQDVESLLADGSNFNKWKRGLTRVILLTLGHANFFDKAENFSKLSTQENTCLLFLIQITVHDELSSLVDQYTTGTEAYSAVETNFQGTIRFRQMELVDRLMELQISGPPTDPSNIPGLFNKAFNIFSDLQKVGASLSPLVESLILQSIVPPPPSMSRSQLFQNISLQLGTKADVSARDIQAILTLAYGETVCFDPSTTAVPAVFRTWHNQPPSTQWGPPRQSNQQSRQDRTQRQTLQQRPMGSTSNATRSQNVGTPGNPTIDDIAAAINNIRKGNTGPSDPNLLSGKPCLYCGVLGHWRSTCPTLRRDAGLQPPNNPTFGRPASGFARQAAPPNDPPTRLEENPAVRSAVGADATGATGVGTVLDSGATHPVSGSFHQFSYLSPLCPPVRLNLASASGYMLATHSGHLKITSGAGILAVPQVLYSPEMKGTLLSLGQFIDSGFKPEFLSNNDIRLQSSFLSFTAQYQNRSWIISHQSIHPIFPSIQSITPNVLINSPSYDWHCRLGHVSDGTVKDFLRRFVPTFDLKSWTPFICETCKTCKSERRQHHLPNVVKFDERLDLLVTDVLGPLDPDINGHCFLLTVRDHATTYSFIFPMKTCSEVLSIIIALIKRIFSVFKLAPKFIRCDNGGEYTSKTFESYLSSVGTSILFTSPYTLEQNGEAERLNRTLGDIARTTLQHSSLPDSLWSYAYRCACYLINRISNSRCKSSPLELWSNREPSATSFYPFGTKACIHIPKERRRKLDTRGWIGYLVGYQDDEQGWFFWNPMTRKVVNSECAEFLDFQGKQLIPAPNLSSNTLSVRRTLHLGHETTKQVCESQDAQIDEIQAISDADIPCSLKSALASPEKESWRAACMTEWDQLVQIDTFDIEEKEKKHSIGTWFVFDIKRRSDGSVEKLKARFVVRGFRQKLGRDVKSTFAPTASLTTLRLLLTLAIINKWKINSFDITGAFVHSPIDETIFVDPPVELFRHLKGKVLKLKKALYGTRQASRCWWKHFKGLLQTWGFDCNEVEECLYRYKKGKSIIIIWIHVDDGIVFSNNDAALQHLRRKLEDNLRVKWDDRPDKLVGIKMEYENDAIYLSQPLLIEQTIKKFQSEVQRNIIPTYTPLAGDKMVTSYNALINATLYQSLIGSLNYIALGSRPDLSFAVNFLARFSSNPDNTHWNGLKHLVQYLATTQDKQLKLEYSNGELVTWADANWGGEFQRSTSGFIIKFMGSPIAWGS